MCRFAANQCPLLTYVIAYNVYYVKYTVKEETQKSLIPGKTATNKKHAIVIVYH